MTYPQSEMTTQAHSRRCYPSSTVWVFHQDVHGQRRIFVISLDCLFNLLPYVSLSDNKVESASITVCLWGVLAYLVLVTPVCSIGIVRDSLWSLKLVKAGWEGHDVSFTSDITRKSLDRPGHLVDL